MSPFWTRMTALGAVVFSIAGLAIFLVLAISPEFADDRLIGVLGVAISVFSGSVGAWALRKRS